ncbi:MAG: murein transglycosylase [Alphaproteobacteria bacterium]|nr:MAG: murein transglycosylase [Alphaproteobacteria bacterium]
MRRAGFWLAVLSLVALSVWAALFMLPTRPEGLSFRIVRFEDLPGWRDDNLAEALPALYKSCDRVLALPSARRMPGASIGGTAADWYTPCGDLMLAQTDADVRAVLMDRFVPLEVAADGETMGTFTGYYETLLHGSLTRDDRFRVPLYARPPELVSVDLGAFRDDLKGRRIAGRVEGGRLVPYADRADIESGVLRGRDLEILWVDDPVDAFFLHIQGSGRVRMPDGQLMRVGYADQNGHPYFAIGRKLIADGEIPREKMSMQAIRAWLATHPDRMDELMNSNPSFVFFRILPGEEGPFGSAGVALTPGRSLAIDRQHLPQHAPIWLSTSHPDPAGPDLPPVAMNRLMVAQDTGGAIAGEVRGDVFWGFGPDAEAISGPMNNKGRYWLLLPKALAEKAVETGS